MTFDRSTYTVILEAVSPIAHHAESFGNTAAVMTEPVRQPDGSMAKVPIITGDTMRHGLRESAAFAFLDAAGLLDNPCLTEAALRLLFAGGTIGGASGSSVSITDYRRMVELVPSLGLLGGCAGNRMTPGRIQVDRALLICEASMAHVGAWAREWVERTGFKPGSHRSAVTEVTRVRMDPTLVPTQRSLMNAESLALTDGRLLASEAASNSDDALAARDSKSSMMPRSYEIVATGSHFVWSVTASTSSELERDTFDLMLASWLSNMLVGGKKGTGNGRLEAREGSRKLLARPSAPETMDLSSRKVGDVFRAHVSDRRAEIRDFLSKVEA